MTVVSPQVRALVRAIARSVVGSGGTAAVPPPPGVNRVAWFYDQGLTADKLRIADSVRKGTRRPLQPGRCYKPTAGNQSISVQVATTGDGPAITIALEYARNVGATSGWVVSKGGASNWQWGIRDSGGASLQVYQWSTAGTSVRELTTPILANTGTTHNKIVVALSTEAIRVWVDGTLYENTTSLSGSWGTSGGSFRIGERADGSAGVLAKFSNLRVWHTARTADLSPTEWRALVGGEVLWLKLDEPSAAVQQDSSGNGNDGTINNWSDSVHYLGPDIPFSYPNEVGFSSDNKTNLIAAGTDLTNAAWTKSRTTILPNVDYSPVTGQLTADEIVEATDTAQTHLCYNHTTKATVSKTYSIELYAKAAGRSEMQLYLADATTTDYAVANLTLSGNGSYTKAVSGFSGVYVSIAKAAGGWYRCRITSRSDASGFITCVLYTMSGGSNNYNGDGVSGIIISDVRLLEGSFFDPRNELNNANDTRGNTLQYTGQCPAEAIIADNFALTLNGSNQHVLAGTGIWDTDGAQPMSLRGWFKTSDTSGVICSNADSASPATGWSLFLENGKLLFLLVNSTTALNFLSVDTVATFNDNAWHYYEVTYDASRTAAGVTFEVDGVPQAKNAPSVDSLTLSTSIPSALSSIGSRNGVNLFAGSLCGIVVSIGGTTWRMPCGEGFGGYVYETTTNTACAITNPGGNWSVLQPHFNGNIDRGHRFGQNRLQNSRDLTASNWENSLLIVVPNAGIAPDGTNTATRVAQNSVGDALISKTGHLIPSETAGSYVLSIYVKPGVDTTTCQLAFRNETQGTDPGSVTFNLTGGGSVATNHAGVGLIEALPDGWYRAQVTANIGGSIGDLIRVYLYPGGGATNGKEVYATDWQLEQGTVATPYFRTKESSGRSRIPASDGSSVLAANGLPLTHPAGCWLNNPESVIDFTCGEPNAPIWNGLTIPTAYKHGDSLSGTDVTKRVPSPYREDRFAVAL